ncbi:hypothetical protein HDU80_003021, partial [Chytriomyces hyalinus]
MDAIDTQLARLDEEINAQKKKVDRREEALEKAISDKDPADVRGDLHSLLEAATAELKRLGEKEAGLMRQKEQLMRQKDDSA